MSSSLSSSSQTHCIAKTPFPRYGRSRRLNLRLNLFSLALAFAVGSAYAQADHVSSQKDVTGRFNKPGEITLAQGMYVPYSRVGDELKNKSIFVGLGVEPGNAGEGRFTGMFATVTSLGLYINSLITYGCNAEGTCLVRARTPVALSYTWTFDFTEKLSFTGCYIGGSSNQEIYLCDKSGVSMGSWSGHSFPFSAVLAPTSAMFFSSGLVTDSVIPLRYLETSEGAFVPTLSFSIWSSYGASAARNLIELARWEFSAAQHQTDFTQTKGPGSYNPSWMRAADFVMIRTLGKADSYTCSNGKVITSYWDQTC